MKHEFLRPGRKRSHGSHTESYEVMNGHTGVLQDNVVIRGSYRTIQGNKGVLQDNTVRKGGPKG